MAKRSNGVLGRQSIVNCNENSRLLEFCMEYELVQQKAKLKTTLEYWHLLDYIVVGQRDVLYTRYTNHRLVQAIAAFRIKSALKEKAHKQENYKSTDSMEQK
ncbi:hypothetical protein scyTo_0002045 [Scyliorhinus torazame]|uniref:Uncharacterized protein n=1 Tax=Scyliorhinus torazame TaxID=75743 RepID=A0A401PHG0_SCYTO|nr:hypothetical protein [Scyliorhinus torazame]